MKDRFYKNYLLTILLIVLAFNFVDRMALGLVMQDIKRDLQLSDTELGLLTGFAFAVFYSFMGIPIARWADRGNRITIITVTTAAWSIMVALCGLATSFVQLLLIRIGVAVGEAGATPPAHSLIADYFDRAERPRAMGIYLLGMPLSVFIGYFGASWINELVGWRMMFLILAAPGAALAALARFTLKEPRRDAVATSTAAQLAAVQPTMKELLVTLWTRPSFRNLLMVFSITFFFNYGMSQWLAAFFIRSHGLTTAQIGTWFTLAFGLTGIVGIYWGGALASRFLPSNERLQLKIVALLYFGQLLFTPISFMLSNAHLAIGLMVLTRMMNYLCEGPMFGMIQTLVPDRMRATSIALIYLCANLFGMGLGPLTVGAVSDWLQPAVGAESLRYALALASLVYLWAIWHTWRAMKTIAQDLDAMRAGRSNAQTQELNGPAAPQPIPSPSVTSR